VISVEPGVREIADAVEQARLIVDAVLDAQRHQAGRHRMARDRMERLAAVVVRLAAPPGELRGGHRTELVLPDLIRERRRLACVLGRPLPEAARTPLEVALRYLDDAIQLCEGA
jgi:hypothetical protein